LNPPGHVHFIANCVYSSRIGGGDVHYFHMAEAALSRGCAVTLFGGEALKEHLQQRKLNTGFVQTDRRKIRTIDVGRLWDQLLLFADYFRRLFGTLFQLGKIRPADLVYSVTDYWFDSIPAILSKARGKIMILGMDAPSLREIVFKLRPDVTGLRISSIHYWLSQNFSLWLFRFCKNKRLLYVHPEMKPRLLQKGYREDELVFISNGMDLDVAEQIPDQKKIYDALWVGRVHVQKGIDDLLTTLQHLSKQIHGFKAILIGAVKDSLEPMVKARGLGDCVAFSGFVSEQEKFRLYKCSRVFLMPSHYESWGIVIAEVLACHVPVVAYDLAAYRPVFGDLPRYVPCFDLEAFQAEAARLIIEARAGRGGLDPRKIAEFKQENSWQAARDRFCAMLAGLQ
jgi:glycosyltransferase involved in cell wall biosynthesis